MKKLLLLVALASFTLNAQIVLFEDNFESYTATDNVGEDTDIPATYLSYDVDGDGYNWGLANIVNFTQPFDQIYIGNFIMSASYITNGAGGNGGQGALSPDNILVFPMISIPTNAANVNFIYLVGSGTDPDYFSETYSVQVTTTNDQADILAATPILDTTLAFQGAEFVTLNLDAYIGQDVYISFRHYNTTDEWLIGLDEIQVTYDDASSVDELQALGFSYYPNPVTSILNMNANTSIDSVSILNLLGQEVVHVNPNELQTTIDFSDLNAGVYLVNVQIDDVSGTFKVVKQ